MKMHPGALLVVVAVAVAWTPSAVLASDQGTNHGSASQQGRAASSGPQQPTAAAASECQAPAAAGAVEEQPVAVAPPSGQWVYTAYGWMWVASATVAVAPAPVGHWVYTQYGWTWIPAAAVPAAVVPAGQWVYTAQYGWTWMVYAPSFTRVVAGAPPYMFVYTPALGWRWVFAPWVNGEGPMPDFGALGSARYAWYRSWPAAWKSASARPVAVAAAP